MPIQEHPNYRDVFLSHKSTDKPIVRKLAADIEATSYDDRYLKTWIDEAEIRPGQSIPGMINYGLERSRFIVLVMTSEYFASDSGWTDAEWHAALHDDPDNRKGRIVPVVAGDCPYIPMLLRHLLSIDLRGSNYDTDFQRLVSILREEPLPRPVAYRGQLIRANGKIDRATLIAERSVPEGDPDSIEENLSCNLLPIERMPAYLYEAGVNKKLIEPHDDGSTKKPAKSLLIERVKKYQVEAGEENPRTPAFRVVRGKIYSFHDLESDESILAPIVNQSAVEAIRMKDCIQDDDYRRILISLLNMSVVRHLMGRGLRVDNKRGSNRFYFPATEGGPSTISWKPFRKQTKRTVTKPYMRDNSIKYWLHQAAYIKVVFLGSRFYIQITPTWLLTDDGDELVKGGQEVCRIVNRWTARERNLSVLYHIRFWTSMLRRGPGLISVRVGEQSLDVSPRPAYVAQSYGIANDQTNILEALDDVAPRIALEEETIEVEEYGLDNDDMAVTDHASFVSESNDE